MKRLKRDINFIAKAYKYGNLQHDEFVRLLGKYTKDYFITWAIRWVWIGILVGYLIYWLKNDFI